MRWIHWKVSFVRYCAVMGCWRLCGLLLAMPETVQRGAVPFSAVSVLRDFRNVFRNPIFSHRGGDAVVELHPDDELGGGVAGDLIDAGRDECAAIRFGRRCPYSAR